MQCGYAPSHLAGRSAASRPRSVAPALQQQASPTVPAAAPRCCCRRAARLHVIAKATDTAVTNGTPTKSWHQAPLKHVVDSQQFDKSSIEAIFSEAIKMESVRPGSPESEMLKGYLVATLFYEPSTRTRLSFEAAMGRLGGVIVSTESAGEYSSAAKGETLEDTIRTVENYVDCIVMRHFQLGAAERAAKVASVPIINAGDGPGQHPSQSLLDLYTIQREIGRLDNIKIGMVGDLANGRTVRSLCMLLSMYSGIQMYFVAPEVVKMKDDIKELLTARGIKWQEVTDLREVAADVDVLYQTRIQKERFVNLDDYAKARGKYIIDNEIISLMKPEARVLHPLPRVDEITVDVDSDPRAAYFRQAQNGLYIRMALLKMCILDRK